MNDEGLWGGVWHSTYYHEKECCSVVCTVDDRERIWLWTWMGGTLMR